MHAYFSPLLEYRPNLTILLLCLHRFKKYQKYFYIIRGMYILYNVHFTGLSSTLEFVYYVQPVMGATILPLALCMEGKIVIQIL